MTLRYSKFLKSLFVIGGLLFIILPFGVSAAGIVPDCGGGACGLCDFFLLVSNIFQFIAFKLAPPVAGFLFLAAGILFLVSGGSEERVSQAKKIFVNAFLGLVVIYASFLIVNTLIQIIGKDVESFHKDTWYKFECSGSPSSFNLIKIFGDF